MLLAQAQGKMVMRRLRCLPLAAALDDEEMCLEGGSSREKGHRGINELGFNEDDTKQGSHV
jgi:hypothetical protein